MKYSLPVLLSATMALAWFGPVRIDHEDRPTNACRRAAITLGPGNWSSQPIYVAFQDDSTQGWLRIRGDIMFQKSTDAGRTWLPADVLVRRGSPFATGPDITTAPDGCIYIVYDGYTSPNEYVFFVRSSDGGATWSEPVEVSSDGAQPHIAVDTAGNLVCAWGEYVSVSTDRGVTWGSCTRVDTVGGALDVFVQPGTNHYLVAGQHDRPAGGGWTSSCYLYRSTDMGQTFQPGVRLDTFGGDGFADGAHVVADAHHIVCSYTDPTEARTLYTPPDTWGSPHFVGHSYRGPRLAISADGRVHAALMDPSIDEEHYHITYASSFDHGVSWSFPEFISGDTAADEWEPDIAADSAGHTYLVWGVSDHTLFSTNSLPSGIVEQPTQPCTTQPIATVIRNVLFLPDVLGTRSDSTAESDMSRAALLDISGREVMDLKPGANDVSVLAPGIYFVRSRPSAASRQPSAVTKVVISR